MHGLKIKRINTVPHLLYDATDKAKDSLNMFGGDFYVQEINKRQAILVNETECPPRHCIGTSNHKTKCQELTQYVDKVVKRFDPRLELYCGGCSYDRESNCIFIIRFMDSTLF